MKEEILKLFKEGKNFTEIKAITGASNGTIAYHCSPNGKAKSLRRRQINFRRNMTELKMEFGGKCQICNYNKCLDALDFHHTDPTTKDRTYHAISAIFRNCSIQKAKEEAAKCILICANCHREIHAKN
jgi:hypothetical protein